MHLKVLSLIVVYPYAVFKMIVRPQLVQQVTYQMLRKASQDRQTNIGNKTTNHRVLKQPLMRVALPKMMMVKMMMMMMTRLMMVVMVVGIVKIKIKVMTVMMKKVTVMKILRVKTK